MVGEEEENQKFRTIAGDNYHHENYTNSTENPEGRISFNQANLGLGNNIQMNLANNFNLTKYAENSN